MPNSEQRPRAPERRRLARAVVAVTFAVFAAWSVDWLARAGAESLVARSVQQAEHLGDRPTVAMHGLFFLPQLVSGNYDEVDITVHDVRSGPLRISTVTARLYGAHASLNDVVSGAVTAVPVDRTRERATLTYADLNAYLAARGEPVTVSAGPPRQIKITMHAAILGRDLAVSADARVGAAPGAIRITPTRLDTGNALLDTVSQIVLGARRTIDIPTASLPFGQHVTAIAVSRSHLTVDAAGRDVVVAALNQ
jgi:hypothetical protein